MTDTVLPFPGGPKGSGPDASDPPEFKFPEAIRVALEMQREALFDAMVIVETTASGIAHEYDCEKIGNRNFERTLEVAYRMLDKVAEKIDVDDYLMGAATDPDVLEEIESRERKRRFEREESES